MSGVQQGCDRIQKQIRELAAGNERIILETGEALSSIDAYLSDARVRRETREADEREAYLMRPRF